MTDLLIVDLESTCWKPGEQPPDQFNDVIEIGWVLVRNRLIVDAGSVPTWPTTSEVSPFCTELTGWTGTKLAELKAQTFIEAMLYKAGISSYKHLSWASWGAYDRIQLEAQCLREGLSFPLSRNHINLKALASVLMGTKPLGMAKALDKLGLTLEGRHHSGVDDAMNIARIWLKLTEGLT